MSGSGSMDAAVAVGRFGLGAKPGELARAAPDPRGWLKAQITRSGAEQPAGLLPGSRERFIEYRQALLTLQGIKRQQLGGGAPNASGASPAAAGAGDAAARLKAARQTTVVPVLAGVRDEILARTRLATVTDAPFRERWTLFWANHFTVSTNKHIAAPLVGPFEREAIRPHVFGKFEAMLVASSTHPAMLLYLDQARSSGPHSAVGQQRNMGLNENLGREIMELHSVGAEGGYTQADVTEFARALTGYSIGLPRDGRRRKAVSCSDRRCMSLAYAR